MRSIFALVNADTRGFSRRARGGRTVKPEMPTMRQSSPSRYSASVVSSVRQTMRDGYAAELDGDIAHNLALACAARRPCKACAALSQSAALFPALHLRSSSTGCSTCPRRSAAGRCAWSPLPLRYLYALLRDLARGDLGLRAMSLVYSTLFAIVPVVAVAFSVLKAFGYHRELEPVLFEFLRPLGDAGLRAHREHHGIRRERAGHAARHHRLRVPAVHRVST